MGMLSVWQIRPMTIAGVFIAIFIGAALISAKKQSPEDSSKERRMAPHATQDPAPQLHFRKIEDKEALEWASDNEAERKGVELFSGSYKLYPLDKETVFFFGELRTPAVSIRSFLLRSGDGGKTWRDMMSPVYGSEVSDVFFLDSRSGWALTLWTTEGPGDVKLFSSKDGGMTWRKVSEVPKRDHTGQPVAVKFADVKNGEIEMLYEDEIAVLRTKDGGRTWAESRTVSLEAYEKRKQETDPSGQDIVQGKDGSQWQLMEKDERVRVLRRIQANEAWKEMCAIPMSYGYSKGRILVHQK
jgi:photosystem II stability/assembly factor-like uncharacterized protein